MAKLIEITGKALSGEWGLEDKSKTGIPVLRTTNFTNFGIINYGDVITRNITKKNISEKFLRKGDIIIEKSGGSDKQPVGRVVLFNGEENRFLFNNFTGVLRVKDHEKWVPDYVFYALFANYRNGGTRKYENKTTGLHNLKTDLYINKYEIEWVNITEQKNVCATLRKIESIISDMNKEITYLDNLIKARFVEMFGTREKWNDANWKITSIDEIIEKPKSGEWGQKDESGRGIGVIRTTNFSDRGAVYFNSITTRDIPREKLITKGIKNGDILIEKSGGSDKKPVGRVVLYTGESNKYLNNNFTAILRINNNTEVNNIFLFTFLYINYWQGGTKVFESKTTGIHNLNLKEFLNKTKIAIPDMLLQNQFATFVAQIDKSKFAVQKSLEKTQLLFDSLMQEYFG